MRVLRKCQIFSKCVSWERANYKLTIQRLFNIFSIKLYFAVFIPLKIQSYRTCNEPFNRSPSNSQDNNNHTQVQPLRFNGMVRFHGAHASPWRRAVKPVLPVAHRVVNHQLTELTDMRINLSIAHWSYHGVNWLSGFIQNNSQAFLYLTFLTWYRDIY